MSGYTTGASGKGKLKSLGRRLWRDGRLAPLILIALAVLFNEWSIGYLWADDGRVDDGFLLAGIRLFDLTLVALGILLLVRGPPLLRRREVMVLLACGLGVLAVEFTLQLLVPLRGEEDGLKAKAQLPAFRGKSWAREMFRELEEVIPRRHLLKHPFLGWKMGEYHGTCINTDENGMRRTWNPDFTDKEAVQAIYIFGGSTLWGFGARDEGTIPSQLSRLLAQHGYSIEVYNYGDLSYTSTQELLHLALLLREGHRPDFVVFYDGVNDAMAAYLTGVPGALFGTPTQPVPAFYRTSAIQDLAFGLKRLVTDYSVIYRVLSRIPSLASGGVPGDSPPRQLAGLAEDIANNYARNLDLLDHLARAYGFRYLALWQPVAFTEAHLFEEERKASPRLKDEGLGEVYRTVRKALAKHSLAHFFDLAGVLEERTGPVYFDIAHLTEEGNALVAEKIFEVAEKKLLESPTESGLAAPRNGSLH